MQQRDNSLDILRGVAIVIMVYANLLPTTDQSYFALTRFLSSIAAPFFVILSGMMIVLSATKHSFVHCLKRSLMIFSIACLVDIICWQTPPMFSFDILYFIAFSLPLAYLVERHCSLTGIFCLIAFCLSSSQYLLATALYQPTPLLTEAAWPGALTFGDKLLRLTFIDGDFPLINWFAFTLSGLVIGRWYFGRLQIAFSPMLMKAVTAGSLLIGGGVWLFFPGDMVAKEGYAELFYPLMPGCFIFMVSLFLSALALLNQYSNPQRTSLLSALGQHSLFCYTLHLFIIGVFIDRLSDGALSISSYGLLLAMLYASLSSTTLWLSRNKQRFSARTPQIIRLWLGV